MNMGLTLLDELEYSRAPLLTAATTHPSAPPSLACTMSVSGSQRAIQLRSPYFIRALGATELGAAWSPLCNALRQHDIPIFSSVESLDGVPAASVPARWSGRPVDESFNSVELTTADLFEVTCFSRDKRRWTWPSEIAFERIDSLLRSVRAAAGGDTPVGLSLPLGCHPGDLERCLTADIDFISLNCTHTLTLPVGLQPSSTGSGATARALPSGVFLAVDLHSIVLCRQMLQQHNRADLPMLVTAPVVDVEQVHKLLALGASAVSIDNIVRQSLALDLPPSQEQESVADLRRRLPSLSMSAAPAARKTVLPQVRAQLTQARQTLVERLQSVGACSLAKFNQQCLVSVSQRAQQVTGVRRLEL